jgi:NAD(P)-dependent dehydrogenase (short-subunit alcohol dehydrogenase family)
MELNFADKVVLLTGAGGGIGSEVARGFSACHGKVVLTDVNEENIQLVSKEISGRGGSSWPLKMDVSQRSEVEKVLDQVERRWGVPDVLVNVAGVINRGTFLDNTDEDWDRLMGVNLKGTWICSQITSRRMIASKKKGAIVNFGSVTSEVADANQVIYAASKRGVRSLTKAMAIALAPYGIRVNSVGPGTIRTEINRAYMEKNPEALKDRLRRSPFGRLGAPEDVVGGVLYLASDLASYVTGITLFIEAGRLSQNTV